jgi:hypothetical protein
MTASHLNTLPDKSVQFCSVTRDFEIQVNGRIVGYAATKLRGYQMANEHVYLLLSSYSGCPVDLSQDDADALLAAHLQDLPYMEVRASVNALEQPAGVYNSLIESHPVMQLVREAAWLATYGA